MDKKTAQAKLLQEAELLGYDLKRCKVETKIDPSEGDYFLKLTPPNNLPVLRQFFDPTQQVEYVS